jgi:hypothetical protein
MLTAVQSLRRSCGESASTENAELGLSAPRGLLGGAGRRTPCAGRAVMLPAVQSLRLACTEGAGTENAELGLSAPRCGLGEVGLGEGRVG